MIADPAGRHTGFIVCRCLEISVFDAGVGVFRLASRCVCQAIGADVRSWQRVEVLTRGCLWWPAERLAKPEEPTGEHHRARWGNLVFDLDSGGFRSCISRTLSRMMLLYRPKVAFVASGFRRWHTHKFNRQGCHVSFADHSRINSWSKCTQHLRDVISLTNLPSSNTGCLCTFVAKNKSGLIDELLRELLVCHGDFERANSMLDMFL